MGNILWVGFDPRICSYFDYHNFENGSPERVCGDT